MTSMDAEGIPDLETPINEDEGLIPPRDHPQAVGASDDGGIGGQLVDAGSADVEGIDDEKDAVASVVEGGDDVALSAEEAAMHLTDTP